MSLETFEGDPRSTLSLSEQYINERRRVAMMIVGNISKPLAMMNDSNRDELIRLAKEFELTAAELIKLAYGASPR